MRSRLLLLLLIWAVSCRATSVIPPSFPELVLEAESIHRGRVTDIRAVRTTAPDGTPIIKTHVILALERTLKGPDRSTITLEFLGGTIGNESLVVTGMPRFNLGAAEYVFVQRNGVQFCPLVAMGHGRYRIARDASAGRDYIARDNGSPLTDFAEVEIPLAAQAGLPAPVQEAQAASALSRALTPASFEAGILAEVQRPTQRARPN